MCVHLLCHSHIAQCEQIEFMLCSVANSLHHVQEACEAQEGSGQPELIKMPLIVEHGRSPSHGMKQHPVHTRR